MLISCRRGAHRCHHARTKSILVLRIKGCIRRFAGFSAVEHVCHFRCSKESRKQKSVFCAFLGPHWSQKELKSWKNLVESKKANMFQNAHQRGSKKDHKNYKTSIQKTNLKKNPLLLPENLWLPSKTEKVDEIQDTCNKMKQKCWFHCRWGAPPCHHARMKGSLFLKIYRYHTQNPLCALPPTLRWLSLAGVLKIRYNLSRLSLRTFEEGLKGSLWKCLKGLRCRGPILSPTGSGPRQE